ncbi:hypothetical protein NP493_627g01004 [Ridgeia piscesae]|uniref:Uncharacterized protein n=1 Tax=Ridgeia piscesae TaxID=27915 RepID=A0AAD9KUG9_RIDPI|nr:hypothetical protein NP493_627g01004 [Ridgeia piscesae]
MRDTCDDIVNSQLIIIPRFRMVDDDTMLHPHTLTQETSCRRLQFGAEMIIASVLLSFSRRLWSDIHSLASSMHRSPRQTASVVSPSRTPLRSYSWASSA